MKKPKISDLFEGENSSLRNTFDNATKEPSNNWEELFDAKVWHKWLDDNFDFSGGFKLRKKNQIKEFITQTIQDAKAETITFILKDRGWEVEFDATFKHSQFVDYARIKSFIRQVEKYAYKKGSDEGNGKTFYREKIEKAVIQRTIREIYDWSVGGDKDLIKTFAKEKGIIINE